MYLPSHQEIEKFMRASNAIEGEFDVSMVMTPAQIKFAGYLGKLNQNDIEASLNFLSNDLTDANLKQLHKNLAEFRSDLSIAHPGVYRHGGDYLSFPPNCASPGMVEHLMHNYFLDLDGMTAWEAHCKYENIHPFEDLNGRTGRLVWLHKMLQTGEDWFIDKPFLQMFYYQTLEQYGKEKGRLIK